MTIIKNIQAIEVLDSRGYPTIEVDVILKSNKIGRFAVPSGASVSKYEALEIRDNNPNRFRGKGVLKVLKNIHEIIAPKVIGVDFNNINDLDNILLELDGTKNKTKLGANSILGVSLATAKAIAKENKLEFFQYLNHEDNLLPIPLINVINGGVHANNNLCIQEFMIVPTLSNTFKEAIQHSAETFYALKEVLTKNNLNTGIGDEGGFIPNIKNTNQVCEYIIKAIRLAGFTEGKDICLAIDGATSEFFDQNTNTYNFKEQGRIESEQLIQFWEKLCKDYPIISIEDPLCQTNWKEWNTITNRLGSKVQIVGDDLFATNKSRLCYGIKNKSANSILIKLNQIGTLSETLDTISLAKAHDIQCIISHRSGDTEDNTIADLAVGTSVGQIKSGSLSRSERLAKYNRLLHIENILGSKARYSKTLTSKSLTKKL